MKKIFRKTISIDFTNTVKIKTSYQKFGIGIDFSYYNQKPWGTPHQELTMTTKLIFVEFHIKITRYYEN